MLLDPSRPAPIWLVWPYLTWLERLSFVELIAVSVYVFFSTVIAVLRVWKIGPLVQNGDSPSAEEGFSALRKRSARVDKLITTSFYLFGLVLFLGLQGTYFRIDDSKATFEWLILRDFQAHLAFAANVFFMLLVLHVVAWFISYCVGRLALKPIPQHVK